MYWLKQSFLLRTSFKSVPYSRLLPFVGSSCGLLYLVSLRGLPFLKALKVFLQSGQKAISTHMIKFPCARLYAAPFDLLAYSTIRNHLPRSPEWLKRPNTVIFSSESQICSGIQALQFHSHTLWLSIITSFGGRLLLASVSIHLKLVRWVCWVVVPCSFTALLCCQVFCFVLSIFSTTARADTQITV